MKRKELIGKLTPGHFQNGESFDMKVFDTLKATLQKTSEDAWKMPVVLLLMFGLGFLFAHIVGGAIGNGIAALCFILAVPIANLPMIKASKQIKSAYKTLGINQEDINAALKQLKDSNGI